MMVNTKITTFWGMTLVKSASVLEGSATSIFRVESGLFTQDGGGRLL